MKTSCNRLALASLLTLALIPAPAEATRPADATLASADLDLYFEQAELTTVESATHAPKPITEVAENISVITAQEIERSNAHSLQEVLARVPGVLVRYSGREVANSAPIQIQGSKIEDVQIYLDGVRWNDMASGYSLLNQIPVEIVARVEVIKGPASSTWGSAFGGVINIITKGTGTTSTPTGTLAASYGERQTRGASAQMAGQAGPVGYFLHAGALDSDGLKNDRWLDRDTLYAKVSAPLPGKTALTVTMGQFTPSYLYWSVPGVDDNSRWDETDSLLTATLTRPVSDAFTLQLYGSLLDKKNTDTWFTPSTGTPYYSYTPDQQEHAGAIRLYGDIANHTLSLGAESYRNSYDEYQLGVRGADRIYQETWALYANDTIHLGRLTLTPGLRYDANSIADAQLSPSLGATFRLNSTTLLRALAARGFHRPVSMWKHNNFIYPPYQVNPDLESETVNSYQLGVENTAIPGLHLKLTAFRHDSDLRLIDDPDLSRNLIYINGDGITRNGLEFRLETERWHGLSLIANHTYVAQKTDGGIDPGKTILSNLIFDYQGPWGLTALLAGNYTWLNTWDVGADPHLNTMTWDLTATKQIQTSDRYRLDLFATATNLFNGGQYSDNALQNANRWLEGGLRLHF